MYGQFKGNIRAMYKKYMNNAGESRGNVWDLVSLVDSFHSLGKQPNTHWEVCGEISSEMQKALAKPLRTNQ